MNMCGLILLCQNHTLFQTKQAKSITLFQTKTVPKFHTLWGGTYPYSLVPKPPPPPPRISQDNVRTTSSRLSSFFPPNARETKTQEVSFSFALTAVSNVYKSPPECGGSRKVQTRARGIQIFYWTQREKCTDGFIFLEISTRPPFASKTL